MLQPITLWSHAHGPNPWKVAIILEELGLKYTSHFLDETVKEKPYTDINPNGRAPAIEDPNTGLTLWESGAIIEYLVEHYDTTHKISFDTLPERYHALQYLFFQASGQGPYFGQAVWFVMFHPERLPSAVERYKNEIKRVTGVLNTILEGKEYLVGNKCSFADLSFVTWYQVAPRIWGDDVKAKEEFPHYDAWMERLLARPTVMKVLEDKAKASDH